MQTPEDLLWRDKNSVCLQSWVQQPSFLQPKHRRAHTQMSTPNTMTNLSEPYATLPSHATQISIHIPQRLVHVFCAKWTKMLSSDSYSLMLYREIVCVYCRCWGKDKRGVDCSHWVGGYRHVFLVTDRLRHPWKKEGKSFLILTLAHFSFLGFPLHFHSGHPKKVNG